MPFGNDNDGTTLCAWQQQSRDYYVRLVRQRQDFCLYLTRQLRDASGNKGYVVTMCV